MALGHKKIGLLGGSFDPVHVAHIALAEAAYHNLGLHGVQLIPAGNPWQRAPLSANSSHRLAMLKLAIGQTPWLHVNTVEIDRNGPTYTIDTLETLPQENDYYWILGSDQLSNFCTWHAWRNIARRVHLVVAQRPDTDTKIPKSLQEHLQSLNRTVINLPFSPQAVSATEIRNRLAHGKPVGHYLDPAVSAYIRQHRLYIDDAGTKLTV